MANPDGVFLYLGTYPDEASARADYEVVKDLHAVGAVGTYDAAVVTKDEDGKVHVNKDEMATRHGGWGGAAAGAVIGILFPPSIIGMAIVGGAVGGVSGHLWRGLSRSDVKELGDVIDGRPPHCRREHHRRRREQGGAEGREAHHQGARRQCQGRGQGRQGGSQGRRVAA